MQAVGSKVFSTNSGIRSFNTKPESMVFRMGLFDFLKNHTTPEGNVSDSLDTFPEQGKRAETSLGQTTSDAVCSSSDAESVPPNTVTAQESNQENNVIDKELAAFLQKIDKVYDSGNTLLVREDPAWYARQFAGRIGHVHLKDMKPAGPGDRGADVDLYGNRMACAPIGTGTVDFDAVLTALEDGGYHGLLTVEFIVGPDKDYPKSLRGSRLYAEQLLAKTRDTASRHGG